MDSFIMPHEKIVNLETIKKDIEEAFETGRLEINFPDGSMIPQEDIKNVFQAHCSELHKIKSLYISNISPLPDWIIELQSLTELSLDCWEIKFTTLPDSIGNMKNLCKLVIRFSGIESLPDCIGNLHSLKELKLCGNERMNVLPDSIGNLMNLERLDIDNSPVKYLPDNMVNLKNLNIINFNELSLERLPERFGDLQSLTEFTLNNNRSLKILPDSIGNLKKLAKLNLRYTSVEKLPDSIVNCTALEFVDICKTNIHSVPKEIKSVKIFIDNLSIELIPQGDSISYLNFCNSYYRLAGTILRLCKKARHEGILSLEDDNDTFSEGFVHTGLRLIIDGTSDDILQNILQNMLEREHDFYRKKLMEAAMEGLLCIQNGNHISYVAFLMDSIVNIRSKPFEDGIAEYISGNIEAFSNIDFSAEIKQEEECEEIRFIKRAVSLSEITFHENFMALEKHLDHNAIAARDVFECGILYTINGLNWEHIEKILSNLIEHEFDPVQKNFSQAKKAAVQSIYNGDNKRVLLIILCSFFDESISRKLKNYLEDL